MVASAVVLFDPTASPGSKFQSTAVKDEIALVAPGDITPGSVTTSMIADDAITAAKIAPGAVTSAGLATGAVQASNIDDGAVTAGKLAAGALTNAAAGPGIVTATSSSSSPISLNIEPITEAAYAALGSPDPNTLYLLTD